MPEALTLFPVILEKYISPVDFTKTQEPVPLYVVLAKVVLFTTVS